MPKELRHTGGQKSPSAAGPAHSPTSYSRPVSAWSAEDDEKLKAARTQGLNWQPIATKHFPTKSANACRKRHERLMERKQTEDWEGDKLEDLATAYMEVRQEMWSILAKKVDAKWNIVEGKVMHHNLAKPIHVFRAPNILLTFENCTLTQLNSAWKKASRTSSLPIVPQEERSEVRPIAA